jgi:SNF2 family DNA or RNA helicase
VLVVCPKSVMDNWHAEAVRFAPGLRVKTWPAAELSTRDTSAMPTFTCSITVNSACWARIS